MLKKTKTIPKTIWTLWWQGFDNSPEIVKKCLASWKEYNPDWEVIALDSSSLGQYLNLQEIVNLDNRQDITMQKISNLIRTNLLAKYGGVWVDATCLCCRPLDTWIDEYASSGFFAFYKPRKDIILSNWFLVSSSNCYLISKFCQEHNLFWNQNRFALPSSFYFKAVLWPLKKIFNRNSKTTRFWFSPFVLKLLRVYPYQIYHYHFAKVVREDKQCEKIWHETQRFSADIPHKLKHFGLTKPMTDELKQEIEAKVSPCYKLTWKYDKDACLPGCLIDYLLSQS